VQHRFRMNRDPLNRSVLQQHIDYFDHDGAEPHMRIRGLVLSLRMPDSIILMTPCVCSSRMPDLALQGDGVPATVLHVSAFF